MRIKNLITGVVSTERADIAKALIRQGLCQAVESDGTIEPPGEPPYRLPRPGDFKAAAAKWAVMVYESTGEVDARKFLVIKLEFLNQVIFYAGAPDAIRQIGGQTPPKEIVAKYKRQWEANPDLRDQYALASEGPCAENQKAAQELAQKKTNDRIRFAEAEAMHRAGIKRG